MQNTSTGCGSHLPTILGTFKNHSKLKSDLFVVEMFGVGTHRVEKSVLTSQNAGYII